MTISLSSASSSSSSPSTSSSSVQMLHIQKRISSSSSSSKYYSLLWILPLLFCCHSPSHHTSETTAVSKAAKVISPLPFVSADPFIGYHQRYLQYLEETKEARLEAFQRTQRWRKNADRKEGEHEDVEENRITTLKDISNGMERSFVQRAKKEGGRFTGRRNPNAPPIDYNDEHPFEIMASLEGTTDSFDDNNDYNRDLGPNDDWYDDDDTYNPALATEPIKTPPSIQFNNGLRFRPIRIQASYNNLPTTSGETSHNRLIRAIIMPEAIKFWSQTLKVYPVKRLFVDPAYCSDASNNDFEWGIKGTDLMVYVSAARYCGNGESAVKAQIAGAMACDYDQYDRPIAGIIHFCYDSIPLKPDGNATESNQNFILETAIHEIGHILGWKSSDFPYFYDIKTGKPRTPEKSITKIKCIDKNTEKEVVMPGPSTLRKNATSLGIEYYEVVTPTVRQVARNHFACDSIDGARLENQPTAGDCFGDHFEERLFLNEAMSSTSFNPLLQEKISPFTLALFEDSGWYKANFSMAAIVSFGHGAGCDFVDKPCIEKPGNVPSYSEGYFCNTTDTNVFRCDSSHKLIANCDLTDLSKVGDGTSPPFAMRYFEKEAMGASLAHNRADFCPTYTNVVFTCARKPSFNKFLTLPGEAFGKESRCYNSDYARPLCMETVCNEDEHVLQVKLSDGILVNCQYDGEKINLPNTSYIFDCPRLADVCPDLICPGNCAGAGRCRWDLDRPYCECFDETDTTVNCNNYTIIPKWAFPQDQPEEYVEEGINGTEEENPSELTPNDNLTENKTADTSLNRAADTSSSGDSSTLCYLPTLGLAILLLIHSLR